MNFRGHFLGFRGADECVNTGNIWKVIWLYVGGQGHPASNAMLDRFTARGTHRNCFRVWPLFSEEYTAYWVFFATKVVLSTCHVDWSSKSIRQRYTSIPSPSIAEDLLYSVHSKWWRATVGISAASASQKKRWRVGQLLNGTNEVQFWYAFANYSERYEPAYERKN